MSIANVSRRGIVAQPVSATFNPASIPGLQAWYDASTIGGLSNNDPVSSWLDLSGNSRTLTQATSGARPLYKTGAQNSLPVVRMDNVDDYLSHTAGADFVTGTVLTVFAVWKNFTDSVSGTSIATLVSTAGVDFGSAANCIIGYGGGSAPATTTQDYRNASLSTKATAQGSTAHQTTHQWNGTNNTLRYDGTAQASVASSGSFATRQILVGCRWTGLPAPSNFNGKDYAELLIYNTAVSGSDVLAVESYLKPKWGTP